MQVGLVAGGVDGVRGGLDHQPAIAGKLAADGFRGAVWSTDPRRPTIERVR